MTNPTQGDNRNTPERSLGVYGHWFGESTDLGLRHHDEGVLRFKVLGEEKQGCRNRLH